MLRIFPFVSLLFIALPVCGASYTYQFTAELESDSFLGPLGSEVYGTFFYDTDLPVRIDLGDTVNYADPSGSELSPAFTLVNSSTGITINSTAAHAQIDISNNHFIFGDHFIVLSSHLTSPDISLPASFRIMIYLRDTSNQAITSTAIPFGLPPLSSFDVPVIDLEGIRATINSLIWIPPGDLDQDGFVGINDLNSVLADWNQAVPPADPRADPSGDSFIGIDDLNTVLSNWNAGTPPINQTSNIPEPATLSILLLIPVLVRR